MRRGWLIPLLALLAGLSACQSTPPRPAAPTAPTAPPVSAPIPPQTQRPPPRVSPYPPAQEDPSKRGDYVAGGLYAPHIQDRAPDFIPDVDAIPEPTVVALPRSAYGNRSPYQVLGQSYTVLDDARGFVETGIASYYGSKFHGRRTSNQEVYDMYAFTAAHKSLPLPSFARVTNLDNGKSVVVRVNDRGPFHAGRIIDLSYAAAVKLGIERAGTGRVEVRALLPDADSVRASTPNSTPPSALDDWLAGRSPATAADGVAPGAGAQPVPVPPQLHLQIGAFSRRSHAETALARLHAAGLPRAVLYDDSNAERPLWRLRIPVTAREAANLSARLVGLGLGLGTPQLVHQ